MEKQTYSEDHFKGRSSMSFSGGDIEHDILDSMS